MEKGNEFGTAESTVAATTDEAAPGILGGIAAGAAAGAAGAAFAVGAATGPAAFTAQDRELLQEIYKGADAAGMKIVGISTVKGIEDSFAGSKDDPVEIGKAATVVVGVGKDGSLMAPDDDRATSTLEIDVRPGVEFDSKGDPRVVWNGYTRQIDKATGQITSTSKSGPSRAEWEAKIGGRSDAEVGNDPGFKDWVIDTSAASAEEAVRMALSKRR